MPIDTAQRKASHDHVVLFYDDDEHLVSSVARYVSDAVEAGEVAVVVATTDHQAAFESALIADGIDIAAARTNGSLITIDAQHAMAQFLVCDRPDGDAFAATIGARLRRAGASGRRIRVYGEMVAVLWEAGHVAAAIELEELWNQLGRDIEFSLLCSYASQSVADDDHAYVRVCNCHTGVVNASRPVEVRTFVCDSASLSDTRRFVAETLDGWGRAQLVDDATIIISELATNAILHARTDFTIVLSNQAGGVRLSVRDASVVAPQLRTPGPTAITGRGLLLVAAIARRWGTQPVGDGKFIWAELGN
ncbi:MAG: MEDS domain-containing protein [Ilumatobacteraceae bacterium]